MALPDNAQVSLAELKDYFPKVGNAQDAVLERAIGRASAGIENEGLGGRRAVYRGPVESATAVVNAKAIVASGNLALVGWAGNAAGRTLVITKVDADRGLVSGTLTVTGTAVGGAAQTEIFDLMTGDVLHGVKFFATVTQVACVAAGMNAEDTISVGTSPGYTELYSPCGGDNLIVPLEWPIRNVVQVHEDWDRLFGSATLLVAGTDYELRNQGGILRAIARLKSGLDSTWLAGSRVVQGRMSAGYRTTAEVPVKVKGVCLELAAWFVQHADRHEWGLSSRSDAMGNRSFSGPPMLTQGMKNELAEFYRAELMPTGERAWTEEAA